MTSQTRPKVLLVEDSDVIALIAIAHLSRFDLEFERVRNGVDAVNAALNHDFDVIFMDVQMPTLDGLQATVRIREDERLSGKHHVRIVGITASDSRSDCLESGMDDFEQKPVSYTALIHELFPQCPMRVA